ncbi:MAG: DUF4111 domain-containing protein [bacterium]|nr:DUF4111 domain-containing protein [bacterium]
MAQLNKKCRNYELEESILKVVNSNNDVIYAAYLFGSYARACSNSSTSDIDLLLITKGKVTEATVKHLTNVFSALDCELDIYGIDISKLLKIKYPTKVDFFIKPYGTFIIPKKMKRDFILNLQDAYECGINIYKYDNKFSLKPINKKWLHSAFKYLLPYYITRFKNPVLSICRYLYFLYFLKLSSKVEAGQWFMSMAESEYSQLIMNDLQNYTMNDDVELDKDDLLRFYKYIGVYIKKNNLLKYFKREAKKNPN